MTVPAAAFPDQIRIGTLVRSGDDTSSLPLESTDVIAQVTGPIATVAVTQRFGNPFAQPVELVYLFPVPHEAAIASFELRIGSRVIKSSIEEVDAARRRWESARDSGLRAGLLEERRANLLSIELANVQPHETIVATFRYYERLRFDDGTYEFVFPMGLTPKYHRTEDDAVRTHAPIASPGSAIGPVELQVSIDGGVLTGDPRSPSHAIDVTRLDERRLHVRTSGDVIPNKDFVLRLPVSEASVRAAAWLSSSGSANSSTALIAAIPPRLAQNAEPAPREFVFVIDRSGSMGGGPLDQARNALRACLRSFGATDTFTIIAFDDRLEWFSTMTVEATEKSVSNADKWLERLAARGGTEIEAAVNAALALPADSRRQRYIVFLTDGAVSADREVVNAVRKQLGTGRLFTFGIGPAVNRALLAGMARAGRGTVEFLQADEDIETALIRFQDRVSFPAVQDIRIEWKGATAWDVYPEVPPDLYYGQALELTARIRTTESDARVLISGKRGGESWHTEIALNAPCDEPAIGHVWAKARIDALLEDIDATRGSIAEKRSEVIALATEHRIVSRYTSFVAIDEQPASGAQAKRLLVSLPLPEGLDIDAFGGAAPGLAAGLTGAGAFIAPQAADMTQAPDVFARSASRGPLRVLESVASFMPRRQKAEDPLRLLARSQNASGSWGSGRAEVEDTAAAILEFVRGGHTTARGDYRRQLRKAIKWLIAATVSGKPAQARLVALAAMAEATGDSALATFTAPPP